MAHLVASPTTTRRTYLLAAVFGLAVVSSAIYARAQSDSAALTAVPGAQADGTTLLPNGWRLAPAGRQLRVGTLPLNIVLSPDCRYAVVPHNGAHTPSFSVVDIASWTIKSTTPIDAAWLGLAFSPDGTRLYSSGGGQNTVQEDNFADGVITRARTFALPAVAGESFAVGLAISRDGRTLFVTRVFAM